MKTSDLLKPADGRSSTMVGVACAVIAFLFAGLLCWLLYLVGWRNPREHGVNELFKPTTLIIFGIILMISLGFALLSWRLLSSKRKASGVLSPLALRAWALFFLATSVLILTVALQKRDWQSLPNVLAVLSTAISMSIAAFILAKRRSKKPPTSH